MEIHLTQQKCIACEGDVPPLNHIEAEVLLRQVPGWEITKDSKSISRSYTFKNFKEALAFINRVGALAEEEGHHPDLHLTDYKHVKIDLSTHAIVGLSNNDFILAAKIDASNPG
jgi:4a-hydroxytetrahydrobiopterin dehydratase